ncbi:diacylglycerol/lipid kinase family protein [Microbacterium sp.]|uniref:diacylglycerol/lipid kinase family protein n=1 Tax=Microbacterium sp. TaxID=51671 RepID=UPI00281289B5|nr:diacylglycerol kinase family lipid kinase [Microbacterium sp.]
MTKIGIVWNPTKVAEQELRAAVEASFGDDTEVMWWETRAEDPGRAMAAEAVLAGCETVIAVGGDGTVRTVAEVVSSAAGQGKGTPTLGIVPQGTGNLLARNLGIPLGDMQKALAVIAAGETRRIDMGWVRADQQDEETGFLVMIGFGLDAHMLAETDDDLKDKAGWLAYVEAMGRAVTAAETVEFDLTVDGGDLERATGHTLLIGNCGMIQGGVTLLPDAEPDDGRLDLLLVSAENALEWMQTVRSVVWDNGLRRILGGAGDAVSTDSARHLTAETVSVSLDVPVPFEIDGEEAGEVSTLEVRIQPGAVPVHC